MIDIIPAILPKNFTEFEHGLEMVKGLVPLVQIDIVDGIFAANTTWPYGGDTTFESILAGDEGLPHWADFDFEFDLMIANPSEDAEQYVRAGASRLVLHLHAAGIAETLERLRQAREDEEFSVEVGLALPSSGRVDELEEFAQQFDFVQVMGIEKVGFQGQVFDRDALALIKAVRSEYPELLIQVDGGVSLENARALAQAGANRLIVGSSIFAADDPAAALHTLQTEANRV